MKHLVKMAIGNDLKRIQPRNAAAEYSLWERRTFNIHRGIIYINCERQATTAAQLQAQVRGIVAEEFRSAWKWLRGFGFGACVVGKHFPPDAEMLPQLIDTRNRLGGVFQWLIYVAKDDNIACGIHTWQEGYLSNSFRRILLAMESKGVKCESFSRDMDAIFRFFKGLGVGNFPIFDNQGERRA